MAAALSSRRYFNAHSLSSRHLHCFTSPFPHSNPFNSISLKRNPKKPSLRLRAPAVPDSNELKSPISITIPPFLRIRDAFKVDELGREILSIALPAALALAADPITSLVDTAFVGHLGSIELAAVGVSVSVFNLVSKLFNVPLLNITTSFVAEEQALMSKQIVDPIQAGQGNGKSRKSLPSVSTALILAAALGFGEAVALSVGSGFLMNIMGVTVV
ncbi:hypothetical protein Cgig2_009482 [Carnegiea gigantea]|uniref:Protein DETOXIFICATION n=1 Tax=Carnegiea gigantea TaxID=171969 RepID=A0A9Q1GRS2_9CARY|nr:hypothetical protein Cgig2_009482 [Carnegiea gigantea]